MKSSEKRTGRGNAAWKELSNKPSMSIADIEEYFNSPHYGEEMLKNLPMISEISMRREDCSTYLDWNSGATRSLHDSYIDLEIDF